MNVTFTAYLLEPNIDVRQKKSNFVPESLTEYSRLLDKQTSKLNYLDSECMTNWDRCNRYYLSSQSCSTPIKRSNKNFEQKKTYKSEFNLSSSPVIYQNENSRLSFLLSLNFDSIIDLETNDEFEGYQLKFVDYQGLSSCVKILPDKSVLNKLRTIELVIKDPSFITQKNPNFTFFFANVSITVLIKCKNTNKYCSIENVNSGIVSVGIKSKNNTIDTSKPFYNDLCSGDFNQYTCILRYQSTNEDYIIIMQPGTNQFEYILGNIDRLRLRNNDSFIIRNDEVWPNNIVYKLYQTKSQIFYLGEFRNPTIKNECSQNKEKNFCPCENECKQCSSKTGSEKIIRAVVLEEEHESKHCTDEFYSAYNFRSIPIGISFMNQSLYKAKITFNKKEIIKKHINSYEFNIDFLPRLCIETVFDSQIFFIYLHLDNIFSTSMTDLFKFKKFQFTFYAIKSNLKLRSHSIDNDALVDASLTPFLYKTINFNEKFVRIPIDLKTTFLIEFKAEPNSSVCPKQNMCIDESTVNNQIQCVDNDFCPKWLYFVRIKNKINGTKCETSSKSVFFNSLGEMLFSQDKKNFGKDWLIFFGAKVSFNFNVSKLKLPINFFELNLSNIDQKESFNENWIIFGFLIPIIFLLFFVFIYYQSILISLFQIESTNIVFYLSINISSENQDLLNDVIQKLICVMKKWFCRFQFSIAKYDCPDRQELIKNADLIVYVCATEQEINDIEKKLLKIGQNSYHDEFNKIHFLDPNSSKCIDIALFSDISEISKKNKNKKKKAKQKFKASNIPLIEINSFKHTKKIFRLPQESKDFLIEIQSKLENKKMCNFEKKCSE
ncbi:hypothetical protein BpHYR1_053284, partial [Brachionus plicatilis]